MQITTIAEQLFFTTVRINTVSYENFRGSGTGFIFSYLVSDNVIPFIVTNKHVVFNSKEGFISLLQEENGRPKIGKYLNVRIDDWGNSWFGHPDPDIDIAICPFNPIVEHLCNIHDVSPFYRSFSSALVPTEDQIADFDAIEPITFVGYPNGLWDSKNFLPIARRGTTATPIAVDFEGTPCFIIDASVFGGSSGSPVFIYDHGPRAARNGNIIISESRFYFVGVVSAVFYKTKYNSVISAPIPTQNQNIVEQNEMLDLGIVYRSQTVIDTISEFLRIKGFQNLQQ